MKLRKALYLGSEVRVGDLCQRISPNGNTLKQGETYIITKVNLASARGTRTRDGKSVNQGKNAIIVVERSTKQTLISKLRHWLISKLEQ